MQAGGVRVALLSALSLSPPARCVELCAMMRKHRLHSSGWSPRSTGENDSCDEKQRKHRRGLLPIQAINLTAAKQSFRLVNRSGMWSLCFTLKEAEQRATLVTRWCRGWFNSSMWRQEKYGLRLHV